jgi:GNAT superfamily N-acetyltransferase
VISIRRVGIGDLRAVVGGIDRSEHVDGEYAVVDGRLVERPVTMSEVPPFDPTGDGPHSVTAKAQFCVRVIDQHAGIALAAFNRDRVAGLAVVAPAFEPPLAWFAVLHVNRADRRHGVASALWDATSELARESDARQLYVSATPTTSAVGFYLSRGCRLADPAHPLLFADEPDDIHLVADVSP